MCLLITAPFFDPPCRYRWSGQSRKQPGFANLRHAGDDLPLRDLIDGVDVTHAFDSVAVALMHRVHA